MVGEGGWEKEKVDRWMTGERGRVESWVREREWRGRREMENGEVGGRGWVMRWVEKEGGDRRLGGRGGWEGGWERGRVGDGAWRDGRREGLQVGLEKEGGMVVVKEGGKEGG